MSIKKVAKVICQEAYGTEFTKPDLSVNTTFSRAEKGLLIGLNTNEIGRSIPNIANILFPLNQGIRLANTSALSPCAHYPDVPDSLGRTKKHERKD